MEAIYDPWRLSQQFGFLLAYFSRLLQPSTQNKSDSQFPMLKVSCSRQSSSIKRWKPTHQLNWIPNWGPRTSQVRPVSKKVIFPSGMWGTSLLRRTHLEVSCLRKVPGWMKPKKVEPPCFFLSFCTPNTHHGIIQLLFRPNSDPQLPEESWESTNPNWKHPHPCLGTQINGFFSAS